VQKSFTV